MKSHVQAVLLVCWWNHAKVLSNIIVNKWRQISHTNSQILRVQTILCCLLRWNLCHHWIGLSAAFTPRSKKWFIYFGKSTQLIGQTLKCLFLNNCNYNFLNYCYHSFSLFNSTYHCIQFTLHLADASANFNHYKSYYQYQLAITPTGWVNELVAGGASGARGFMFFICNMELTSEGQGNHV